MRYILHIIQLAPQKLSREHKHSTGAQSASAWPEDQKRHRGGKPGRLRYLEVLLPFFFLADRRVRDDAHLFRPWDSRADVLQTPKHLFSDKKRNEPRAHKRTGLSPETQRNQAVLCSFCAQRPWCVACLRARFARTLPSRLPCGVA